MPDLSRPWYAYLIKLSRPLGGHKHKAYFYLGISVDWAERFQQHCQGQGAKMLAYAAKYKIRLTVIRVWRFNDYAAARQFETWAKKSVKNHKKLLKLPAWIHLAV